MTGRDMAAALETLLALPARVEALERSNAALRDELAALRQERAELLTVEEAAAARKTTPAAVYKLIQRGRLPAVREGRSLKIPRSAIGGGQ